MALTKVIGAGIGTVTNQFADANMSAGSVVQVVNVTSVATATGTTLIPFDDTIPQNNEGTEFLTLAITPTNSSNKLRIEVDGLWGTTGEGRWIIIALFQDSTANALATSFNFENIGNGNQHHGLSHFMTAGTTSETTFKVRVGPSDSSTTRMNGVAGARFMGGANGSSITITEIAV